MNLITSTRLLGTEENLFGADAQVVCQHIGWHTDIRAVKAYQNEKGDVIATGTSLKADEWQELAGHNGDTLSDGRKLYIANVPRGARIAGPALFDAEQMAIMDDEAKAAITQIEAEERALMEWSNREL